MPFLKRRTEEITKRIDPFRWLYQSARWHRFSKQYLKENRLCKMCLEEGKTVIALQTDHIIPLIHYTGGPYDLNNLQPICKSHHSKKTREENKR